MEQILSGKAQGGSRGLWADPGPAPVVDPIAVDGDGGDSPAWTRKREPYRAAPGLIRSESTVDYAELHCHTTWSDGKASVREMAEAALSRGYHVIAITDHSPSLGITQGVKVEDIAKQRAEIDAAQEALGGSIRILQGSEVEIKADGSLDFPDEVLAKLDIVFASLHVSLRQPGEQVTRRLLNAIRNPHVDVIGHPTGRLIPDREGADLDMEAVLAAASESGVALEISAHPERLDLNDVYARRAVEMSIPLSINTDAHRPEEMGLMHFGIAVARRGWVEAKHVINTWGREKLLDWLGKRG
jgi:DNA polymerase (family 10)